MVEEVRVPAIMENPGLHLILDHLQQQVAEAENRKMEITVFCKLSRKVQISEAELAQDGRARKLA